MYQNVIFLSIVVAGDGRCTSSHYLAHLTWGGWSFSSAGFPRFTSFIIVLFLGLYFQSFSASLYLVHVTFYSARILRVEFA